MFHWYLLEDILVLAESESVVAVEKEHPYVSSYSSIYNAHPLPLRIHNSKTYIQLKAAVIKNAYYEAFAAKQMMKADFAYMLYKTGNGAIGFQFVASGETNFFSRRNN
jgi:hypothetical protein